MSKFVRLNIDTAGGTPMHVVINTRHVVKVTGVPQRGTGGKAQCMVEFVNGQPLTVVGDLEAVLGTLEARGTGALT